MPDGLPVKMPSEQADSGLIALAYSGGRATLAAEQFGFRREQLYAWRKQYHERYNELCEQVLEERAKRLATEAEDVLAEGVDAHREALRLTAETLPQLSPRDLHMALRNIAISNSQLHDKLISPLRGRPNQVVEVRRNESEIWAELSKVVGSIPGTAVEIPQESGHTLDQQDSPQAGDSGTEADH